MVRPSEPALANDRPEIGWRSWLSIPQDRFNNPWIVLLLIIVAWAVCVLVRYQWIAYAADVPQYNWIGGIQPTTHDAFTHGAVLQQHLEGRHADNPHLFPIFNSQGALHALTWALLKVVAIPIPAMLLWAPIFLSSLIVIPYVLLGRLFGSALWGFTAALLGGVAWNFYERTMAGYFDTDVFSFGMALLLMFFLVAAHQRKSLVYGGLAACTVFLYPFFYAKGLVIGAGVAGCFIGLQLLCLLLRMDVDRRLRLIALVAAGIAASPWSNGQRINEAPWRWFVGLGAIVLVWWLLARVGASVQPEGTTDPNTKSANPNMDSGRGKLEARIGPVGIIVGACLVWLVLSLPWPYFMSQVRTYSHFLGSGDTQQLAQLDPVELQRAEIFDEINFRKTHKHTVLESQGEAAYKLGQRIAGSATGAVLALIGYVLLCIRYPGFLIGIPFVAAGLFAFDGGLRFTTWGGLLAAPALTYTLFIIVQALLRSLPVLTIRVQRFGAIVGGMLLASPFIAVNYTHAISFKVGTVFSLDAIEAMQVIKRNSSPGDYVMAWWDYGSGLWYYADRNVLMTPISASDDCWTVATIVSSDSQKVAAGLSRLAAEASAEGYRPSSHGILGLDGNSPIRPDQLIEDLKADRVELPEPTCDVFLYIPWEMMKLASVIEAYSDSQYALPTTPESGICHIFPREYIRTEPQDPEIAILPNEVRVNLSNLTTYYPTQGNLLPVEFKSVTFVRETKDGQTIVFDGPKANQPLYRVVAQGGTGQYTLLEPGAVEPPNSHWVNLVILESTSTFMMLDDDFLNSNLIQMVAMQQYDHDLWELVHKNGYARVFRLKDRKRPERDSNESEVGPEVELEIDTGVASPAAGAAVP